VPVGPSSHSDACLRACRAAEAASQRCCGSISSKPRSISMSGSRADVSSQSGRDSLRERPAPNWMAQSAVRASRTKLGRWSCGKYSTIGGSSAVCSTRGRLRGAGEAAWWRHQSSEERWGVPARNAPRNVEQRFWHRPKHAHAAHLQTRRGLSSSRQGTLQRSEALSLGGDSPAGWPPTHPAAAGSRAPAPPRRTRRSTRQWLPRAALEAPPAPPRRTT